MTRNGYFRYDPTNYHGPLHFYAVFLSQTLFGRNLWALRLPAVIASLLAVLVSPELSGAFRPAGGTACGACDGAFACLLLLWSLLDSRVMVGLIFDAFPLGNSRPLADRANVVFCLLVLAAATGMILSKETYVAARRGAFLLAGVVLGLWQKLLPSHPHISIARQQWTWEDLAVLGGSIALLTIVFFYSGTFLDFPALSGLFETFGAWFHTGIESRRPREGRISNRAHKLLLGGADGTI